MPKDFDLNEYNWKDIRGEAINFLMTEETYEELIIFIHGNYYDALILNGLRWFVTEAVQNSGSVRDRLDNFFSEHEEEFHQYLLEQSYDPQSDYDTADAIRKDS